MVCNNQRGGGAGEERMALTMLFRCNGKQLEASLARGEQKRQKLRRESNAIYRQAGRRINVSLSSCHEHLRNFRCKASTPITYQHAQPCVASSACSSASLD